MATVQGMEFSHSVNGTSLSMAVAHGKEKSTSLFLLLPQTCQWSGNKGLRFRSLDTSSWLSPGYMELQWGLAGHTEATPLGQWAQ